MCSSARKIVLHHSVCLRLIHIMCIMYKYLLKKNSIIYWQHGCFGSIENENVSPISPILKRNVNFSQGAVLKPMHTVGSGQEMYYFCISSFLYSSKSGFVCFFFLSWSSLLKMKRLLTSFWPNSAIYLASNIKMEKTPRSLMMRGAATWQLIKTRILLSTPELMPAFIKGVTTKKNMNIF